MLTGDWNHDAKNHRKLLGSDGPYLINQEHASGIGGPIINWHSFWQIYSDMLSDILSGILSGIFSGIYCDMISGILSNI